MRKIAFLAFIPLILLSNAHIKTIYKTLNPKSISEHIAFYTLYPDTKKGKKALKEALSMLSYTSNKKINFPNVNLFSIIKIFLGFNEKKEFQDQKDLSAIDEIAKNLNNRKLASKNSLNEKEILPLDPSQIDIARALFLSKDLPIQKIKYYEAILDMIALEIISSFEKNPTDEEKIKKLNEYIFFTMNFRFPPLSKFSNEIDSYTLLPSVIDTRKGVCLGLCILYLSIAQRIGVKIDTITIPGHIFLKHQKRVIETTKRGVNIPPENYLSIDTMDFKIRNEKEVIGLSFINEASIELKNQNYEKALHLYEKASLYLKDDILLKQLLGFCYIFTKNKKKGIDLLKKVQNQKSPYSDRIDPLTEDFLKKRVSIEGIKVLFTPFDDTRDAILEKKEQIEKILKKYPKFISGHLLLSNIWMQLGRGKEAKEALKKCYMLNKKDPLVTFYLANIYFERNNFKNAWIFLEKTKKLISKFPKFLENFENMLKIKALKKKSDLS